MDWTSSAQIETGGAQAEVVLEGMGHLPPSIRVPGRGLPPYQKHPPTAGRSSSVALQALWTPGNAPHIEALFFPVVAGSVGRGAVEVGKRKLLEKQ